MPDSYFYPDDNKFHCRFSELVRCSNDRQSVIIAKARLGMKKLPSSTEMNFGKRQHDAFREESLKTGLTPKVFKDALGVQFEVREVEKHMATELFDGVIVHFTCDAICKTPDLPDYKTSGGTGSIYQKSMQLPQYALYLLPHDTRIKRIHYLVQRWNKERTEIRGYYHYQKPVTYSMLANSKRWTRWRVEKLMSAEAFVKGQNKGLQDNGTLDILPVF